MWPHASVSSLNCALRHILLLTCPGQRFCHEDEKVTKATSFPSLALSRVCDAQVCRRTYRYVQVSGDLYHEGKVSHMNPRLHGEAGLASQML